MIDHNTPPVVDKHLDAVKCWEDDRVFLAASNLSGRYWCGSLWCFPTVEDAPILEKAITGVEADCGVADILCIKGGKAVAGADSGEIKIYSLEDGSPTLLTSVSHCHEHEDIVTSLSLTSDKSRFVSASFDKSIKVWDIETWSSIATFRPVHAGIVWQVSCSTTDPNIIMSCGQDAVLLLLDLRLPKPATCVEPKPLEDKPTAVAWQPDSNTVFASGHESGNIIVRDIRKVNEKIQYKEHERPIYRLAFSPSKPSWLASVADESRVVVADIGEDCASTIYSSDEHTDFARGLTWDSQNALVTCGWDKKVIKHKILPKEAGDAITNGE